jgi:hypothetical protein
VTHIPCYSSFRGSDGKKWKDGIGYIGVFNEDPYNRYEEMIGSNNKW